MEENKKSAPGWGGRRKGAGAKRTLPPGARTRSVKMTDEELLKVKKVLNESRRNKENVKSVKRISNDTIEIVWYDEEFKGCMKSKHQFCVTKDLIGTVTLDMDVVRKNDVDKA